MVELGTFGDKQTPAPGMVGSIKKELESWRDAGMKEYTSLMDGARAEKAKLLTEGAQALNVIEKHPKTAILTAAGIIAVGADIRTGGKLHEGAFAFLKTASEFRPSQIFGDTEKGLNSGSEFSIGVKRLSGLFSKGLSFGREEGAFAQGFHAEKYEADIDAFLKGKSPLKSFGLDGFQQSAVRETLNSDVGVKATDIELKVIQARGALLRQNMAVAGKNLADLTEEQRQLTALGTESAKDVRIAGNAKPAKIFENVRNAEHALKLAKGETGEGSQAKIQEAEQALAKSRQAAQARLLELQGGDGKSGLIGRLQGIVDGIKTEQTKDSTETSHLLGQARTYVQELEARLTGQVEAVKKATPEGQLPRHLSPEDLRSSIRTEPTPGEAAKIAEGEKALQNKGKPETSYLTYRERYGVDEPVSELVPPKPAVKAPKPIGADAGNANAASARPANLRTTAPEAGELPGNGASSDGVVKGQARSGVHEQQTGAGSRSSETTAVPRPQQARVDAARHEPVGSARKPERVGGARGQDASGKTHGGKQRFGRDVGGARELTAAAPKVERGAGAAGDVDRATSAASGLDRVMPPEVATRFKAANSASEQAAAAIERFQAAKAASQPGNFRVTMRAVGQYVRETNDYLNVETDQVAQHRYTVEAAGRLQSMMSAVDKRGRFDIPPRFNGSAETKLEYMTTNLDGRLKTLGEKGILTGEKVAEPERIVAAAKPDAVTVAVESEATRARQAFEDFQRAEAQNVKSGNIKSTLGALQAYARSAQDYMQAQLVKGGSANVEEDPIVRKAVSDLVEMMPPGKDGAAFSFKEGTPPTYSAQLRALRQLLDSRMGGFARQARAIAERVTPPGG